MAAIAAAQQATDSDQAFMGGTLSAPTTSGIGGFGAQAAAKSTSPWAKQMGLELYTVRDLMGKDQAGTVAKVAALGYKEVEPTGYGGLTAKAYRALLDQNGLTAPSTHATATMGPDFEKTLEGMQIVGHKYVTVSAGGPGMAGRDVFGPQPARGGARGPAPARGGARGPMPGGFGAPETADTFKKEADMMNQAGAIAKKYGMQILRHNHAIEFQKFAGTDQCPYDILVGQTDPDLVVMQMDIGWACVAGEDPLAWWTKYPGRFGLWHVKDFMGLNYLFPQPEMTERERMSVAGHWMTPVGLGMINYAELFKHASLAGMKHFCVEQDTAANWGDSVAAAGVSYKNLLRDLG